MKKLVVFLTVIALLAVGLLLPAAAVADPPSQTGGMASASVVDPPMPLDGTWVILDETMPVGGYFSGPWTWAGVPWVKFMVTDLYVVTDQFRVYDNGIELPGSPTPNIPDWDDLGFSDPFFSPPWTADPDVAWADGRFSRRVFYVGPPTANPVDSHSIMIQDIHIPPTLGGPDFPDGTVAFNAEVARRVDIDIKPGSYPNAINLKSKGVIPVAILGSDTFDVMMVDTTMPIRFAGALIVKWAYEDVNGDGFMDLIAHFKTQDTHIQPGQTGARIGGRLMNGILFFGWDSIVTVPPE